MNKLATDPATVEQTASILVNNLIAILNEIKSTTSQLDEALKPFAVTQWAKRVIEFITVNKINRLFGRLKRSGVSKDILKLVIDHFHRALRAETAEIPPRFTVWRETVSRTSLTVLSDPDTWIEVWTNLETHRIPDPLSLARVSMGGNYGDFGGFYLRSPNRTVMAGSQDRKRPCDRTLDTSDYFPPRPYVAS